MGPISIYSMDISSPVLAFMEKRILRSSGSPKGDIISFPPSPESQYYDNAAELVETLLDEILK